MKNKLIRKLMIFGLVCSTIVSTGPVTVLAAGTEAQTENTKDTEAETKVSETKEPESETKAKEPETKEPETKEPESETKAKEPEIFRGFWPLFYISKYLKEEIYIWNTRFLIVYQVFMVR